MTGTTKNLSDNSKKTKLLTRSKWKGDCLMMMQQTKTQTKREERRESDGVLMLCNMIERWEHKAWVGWARMCLHVQVRVIQVLSSTIWTKPKSVSIKKTSRKSTKTRKLKRSGLISQKSIRMCSDTTHVRRASWISTVTSSIICYLQLLN